MSDKKKNRRYACGVRRNPFNEFGKIFAEHIVIC